MQHSKFTSLSIAGDRKSSLPLLPGRPVHIGILPLRNFTLLAFAAFIDTLRLSSDEGDGSRQQNFRWTIISPNMDLVPASCGTAVRPNEELGDPGRFDYVVIVGGLLRGELANAETLAWIKAAAEARVTLVGLCVGSFAMIKAGVMKGRRACISAYHLSDFQQCFVDQIAVTDQWFLVDGERITSPGGVAAADVAAFIVKRHCGEDWARKGLQLALIEAPRPANHPQPVASTLRPIEHGRLQRAVALIERRLRQPPSLSEVAASANLSQRQLQRLFKERFGIGPQEFSRDIRLRYGRLLLQQTLRTVSTIAEDCGFGNASHFSRHFRASYGLTPLQCREQHPEVKRVSDRLPWRPEREVHLLRARPDARSISPAPALLQGPPVPSSLRI